MSTKKILCVATNEAPIMRGKARGLVLHELTHFVSEVQKAGYSVDVASCKGGEIPLDETNLKPNDPSNKSFLMDERLAISLKKSMPVSAAKVEDYVAIYVPGGFGVLWDLRGNKDLQSKIMEFWSAGKIISSVCHGSCAFIDVKDVEGRHLVSGKRVTGCSDLEQNMLFLLKECPYSLEQELKKSGADYHRNLMPFTSRVEVAGKLITGQNPFSAHDVGKAVVKALS